MTRPLSLLLGLLAILGLAACPTGNGNLDDDDSGSGDDDDTTPPDDDDDDSTPTDDDDDASSGDDDDNTPEPVEIEGVHPDDGTPDFYIHEAVWADFSAETTGAITVADTATSTAVAGASEWLGVRLIWTGDAALAANTAYTATATWNDGTTEESFSWSFTTSDLGTVPTNQTIAGNTYAMDFADGTVVTPQGGEAFLGQFNNTVLLGVTQATETELGVLGTVADTDTDPISQDMCLPTTNLTENGPAMWADPYFEVGPADFSQQLDMTAFGMGLVDVLFRDMFITGTFAQSAPPDGPADLVVEGTVSTYVDVRDTGLGFTCAQISAFMGGIPCSYCDHDPAAQECIEFWIIDLQAELVPELVLVPRTQVEIDADTENCGG